MLRDPDDRLKIAKKVALLAGDFVKESQFKVKNIDHKANIFDLVTNVDKKSQEIIITKLHEVFPNDEFVGEEQEHAGFPETGWYIDPIDGTVNFIHGLQIFGISVAYVENGEPIIGVIYLPIFEELYWAEKGQGAYLNNNRIRVSRRRNLQECLVVTAHSSSFEGTKELDKLKNLIGKVRRVRMFGSACYHACMLARGSIDAFWSHYLKPWDVAAGYLIVKEAGGEILNLQGSEGNIFRSDLIFTNAKISKDLLKLLKE